MHRPMAYVPREARSQDRGPKGVHSCSIHDKTVEGSPWGDALQRAGPNSNRELLALDMCSDMAIFCWTQHIYHNVSPVIYLQ